MDSILIIKQDPIALGSQPDLIRFKQDLMASELKFNSFIWILLFSTCVVFFFQTVPNHNVPYSEKEMFEAQPYISTLSLSEARTKFKLRSRMLEVKNNFKGEFKNKSLECNSCERSFETQDHIMFCEAYEELRKNKDMNCDKDLVNYVRDVMIMREKLKKK